jgi:hypothetical protein
MADTSTLARTFVRAAKIRATALGSPNTPKSILEGILLGQFTSSATNGRTLIRTTEAGGSVEFILPADLGPAEVMAICDEALRIVESSPAIRDRSAGAGPHRRGQMTCPYLGRLGRLPPMGPERNDAEEVSTNRAKERESKGTKRISTGLRSSSSLVSGLYQRLSLPFPGSFVLFADFVDHPSKGSG